MAQLTRTSSAWDTSSAYPSYASDSSSKFIPQIWSGSMIEQFYAATVLDAIANTDHQGEVKAFGDSVVIRGVPPIAIGTYEVGEGLTYETPVQAAVELELNQARSFSFQINGVDKMQSDLELMTKFSMAAGESLKVAVDSRVLTLMLGTAHADNKGATAGAISGAIALGVTTSPITFSSSNAIAKILDMGLVLDEQNVPETGRWIVLPAWACNAIKNSDLKDASITGDATSILRNGRVGMIDRFTVYSSNNLPNGVAGGLAAGEFAVYAGHSIGLTFASQIINTETLKNPDDFGDLVRGLQVFGTKTTKTEAIAEMIIT